MGIVKKIFEKDEVIRLTHLDFKMYDSATIIKTVWHGLKGGHVYQWNKDESPEKDPHICDQCILDKGAKSLVLCV